MPATLDECNQFLRQRYPLDQSIPPRVLEAGGGSYSHFELPAAADLYALDISHGQLVRNQSTNLGLQADIHHIPLCTQSIGLVICFNVIEHLDAPTLAINEMARVLAQGGIMVLGCPERNSLKGWVTRLTPLSFHRWYYKRVVDKQDRGEGHFDAFETRFGSVVDSKCLISYLRDLGFDVVFHRSYDGAAEYQIVSGSIKRRLFAVPYYFVCGLGRWLSLGTCRPERSDLLLVAVKASDPAR